MDLGKEWGRRIHLALIGGGAQSADFPDLNKLDTLGGFSTISYKRDNFCDFLFGSPTPNLFSKRCKFSPLKPLSEERQNNFYSVAYPRKLSSRF